MKLLKPIRVILSLVFFFFLLLGFMNWCDFFSTTVNQWITFFQFVPSFLKFMDLLTFASWGFLFVLLLTLLFGRVYCSSVCPLGTLHDLIIGAWKRIRNRKYKYQPPRRILAYSILFFLIATFVVRENFFINLLDPYGLAGKMFTGLFKPLFDFFADVFSGTTPPFGDRDILPEMMKRISTLSFLFALGLFLLIFILALFKNRWYCNSICPVGTLLGLVSRGSLVKITIDPDKCNHCRLCANVCKTGCIDTEKQIIEFDRCVACFNCLSVCRGKAITYRKPVSKKQTSRRKKGEISRREFIQKTIIGTTAIAGALTIEKIISNKTQSNTPRPVTPPGSVSYWNFSENCVSCHLCVSVCPTQVLQPAFFEYGLTGILQPKMDFRTNYCSPDCVLCSQVCPSGAIKKLSNEMKSRTQIGVSVFIKNNCQVVVNGSHCGICARQCPTNAIQMIPDPDGLQIPRVDTKACNGCGACEYFCPATPEKAMYVESNHYHRIIDRVTISS